MKKYSIDLIGIGILVGVTIAAYLKLQSLPDSIPVHWNIEGVIDHQVNKYWIFIGSITSLAVYSVMAFVLNLAIGMPLSKSSPGDSDRTLALQPRGYVYMGLVKISLMLVPLFYTLSIVFFYPNSKPLPIIVGGSLICIIVALYAIIKLVQNLAEQMGNNISFQETILNYIGYYDPNDPRVFVDKRIGVGMTVNFATRGGKIFLWVFVILPFMILFGMAIYILIK